jgi:hypothetical protein
VLAVHAHEDEDHEDGLTEADRADMVAAMLQRETLRRLTVGIDIGSSTSHLLFARVLFQRRGSRAAPGSSWWSGRSNGVRPSC